MSVISFTEYVDSKNAKIVEENTQMVNDYLMYYISAKIVLMGMIFRQTSAQLSPTFELDLLPRVGEKCFLKITSDTDPLQFDDTIKYMNRLDEILTKVIHEEFNSYIEKSESNLIDLKEKG